MARTIPEYFDLVPQHFDEGGSNILSLNIVAKRLDHFTGYPRGKDSIGASGERASWRLVAPNEISETVSHNWEEYESIATRIAQAAGTLQKAVASGTQMSGAIATGSQAAWNTVTSKGGVNSFKDGLRRAAGMAANQELSGALNYRVDSTLVYKNSQRREYQLTLELATYDDKTSGENIFNAIRKFQSLSCPAAEGGLIKIEFPAVFKVETSPVPLIFIEYAALTAVQPTFKPPYVNGYSRNVDLQLTFQDIEPTYRGTFDRAGRVRTS